jgi:hypothetical protein
LFLSDTSGERLCLRLAWRELMAGAHAVAPCALARFAGEEDVSTKGRRC